MVKILIKIDTHNILYSSLFHSCITNVKIINDHKSISNELKVNYHYIYYLIITQIWQE